MKRGFLKATLYIRSSRCDSLNFYEWVVFIGEILFSILPMETWWDEINKIFVYLWFFLRSSFYDCSSAINVSVDIFSHVQSYSVNTLRHTWPELVRSYSEVGESAICYGSSL